MFEPAGAVPVTVTVPPAAGSVVGDTVNEHVFAVVVVVCALATSAGAAKTPSPTKASTPSAFRTVPPASLSAPLPERASATSGIQSHTLRGSCRGNGQGVAQNRRAASSAGRMGVSGSDLRFRALRA